jgi:predicted nucleotidyltransferase
VSEIDPARVFETLNQHGVDYLTIGAWAVVAHGYVRATTDVDFVARVDAENMQRLASALKQLNARLRGVDADKLDIDPTDARTLGNGASFTLQTDAGPVDFLNDVPGAESFETMRERAKQAQAGGIAIWVVGFEDLIRMKRASGRPQDLLDIEELESRRTK